MQVSRVSQGDSLDFGKNRSAERAFLASVRPFLDSRLSTTMRRNPPWLLTLALASYLGADAFSSGHVSTKGSSHSKSPSSSSSSHDAPPSTASAATTSSSASLEPPHLDVMEERERREMSWLVKSTSRLLGDTSSLSNTSTTGNSSATSSSKRGNRRRNQNRLCRTSDASLGSTGQPQVGIGPKRHHPT